MITAIMFYLIELADSKKRSNFMHLHAAASMGNPLKTCKRYWHCNVKQLERNIQDLLRELMCQKKQSSWPPTNWSMKEECTSQSHPISKIVLYHNINSLNLNVHQPDISSCLWEIINREEGLCSSHTTPSEKRLR